MQAIRDGPTCLPVVRSECRHEPKYGRALRYIRLKVRPLEPLRRFCEVRASCAARCASAGLGRNAYSQRRWAEAWLELLLELLALCDGADAWLDDDGGDGVLLDVCAYDGA